MIFFSPFLLMEIVWAVQYYSTRKTWFFNLPSSDAQLNLIILCVAGCDDDGAGIECSTYGMSGYADTIL